MKTQTRNRSISATLSTVAPLKSPFLALATAWPAKVSRSTCSSLSVVCASRTTAAPSETCPIVGQAPPPRRLPTSVRVHRWPP